MEKDHAEGPRMVAALEGGSEHAFGDVDGAPGAAGVKGLVTARSPVDQQVSVLDHGDADAALKDGVQEIFGNEADGAVEVVDQVVAGVEARQTLVLFHQDTGAQPGLLAEDNGLFGAADDGVDGGGGDLPFAQAAIGAGIGVTEELFIQAIDLGEVVPREEPARIALAFLQLSLDATGCGLRHGSRKFPLPPLLDPRPPAVCQPLQFLSQLHFLLLQVHLLPYVLLQVRQMHLVLRREIDRENRRNLRLS